MDEVFFAIFSGPCSVLISGSVAALCYIGRLVTISHILSFLVKSDTCSYVDTGSVLCSMEVCGRGVLPQ